MSVAAPIAGRLSVRRRYGWHRPAGALHRHGAPGTLAKAGDGYGYSMESGDLRRRV